MDKIIEKKKSKKVGLLINNGSQMFSNGIIQNAYFMYVCFQQIGIESVFLTHDDSSKLEYKNLPICKLSTNLLEFDPSEFHTIITITRSINKEMYNHLKSHKVAVISFICGNTLMHSEEEFVRGPYSNNVTTFIGKGSCVDEAWVIPSYEHSLDYIETTRGVPAYIVPHLWSPEVLLNHAKQHHAANESDLLYNIAIHTGKKIEIVIMEPNLALFKNAWVPIIAADKLYKEHPELIEFVFAFNFPDHTNSWNMADNCYLGSKLRRFKRLSVSEILKSFNTHESIPIFLSYQLYNSLNYLYYEILYFGYPLVHNSPDLDGCGYYYPEHNLSKCVEQILLAYKSHNKTLNTYIDKSREYLKRVDPLDPDVCKIWDQMFNSVIAKNIN
jgi:hypothetical protein